ncbi:MAG: filamentous hemagglutinin N-terminal domain-containing protein [Leptolyngbyaceae cyanobacterium bins.349]|nr:filamentous hemagglutinin N-terminal domain-containing protein [Leptolyngbyaceae cyanobacterium bins.349]
MPCFLPRRLALTVGLVTLTTFITPPQANAQIVPDNTLPINSNVTPGCTNCIINGGTERGVNLYHSFREFSIPTGGSAWFNNAPQIQNILTRVTGNSISNIDGLIQTNGTANLFLLNPNGIVFGPNAQLQIGGSFLASTANSFKFPDGSEFSATNPQAPPLLTINITPGLQSGTSLGNLSHTGNLAVNIGQSLALHGDTVISSGTLTAPGGRVEVLGDRVALTDNAQVDVSAPGGGGTVLIGGDLQGNGTVPNASRTFVGPNVEIKADAIDFGNGGTIIVWSDEATRFYGRVSARGGNTSGNGGFVEVSGKQFLDYQGNVNTLAPNGLPGTLLLDPTNITVVPGFNNPPDLVANDQFADPGVNNTIANSTINAATTNVTLQATNDITFNAPISIAAATVGLTAQSGNSITVNSPIQTNGGAIRLSAGDPVSGAPIPIGSITITADARSRGGNIALATPGITLVDNAVVSTDSGFLGDSGNLAVQTGQLILQNFGQIGTTTFGTGNAGNVEVRATEIEMTAPISFSNILTGITAQATPGSTGNAGNVFIRTVRLTARNAAQVSAAPWGSGDGGDIVVRANEIELIGRNQTGFPTGFLVNAQSGSSGNSGSIQIETDRLTAQDGGGIYASTFGTGNAGQVSIKAFEIELTGVGEVYPSALSAQAHPGATGKAGQVFVETRSLLVQNGAVITADSFAGDGGSLSIWATDSIGLLNRSFLSAGSSGQGAGGDLVISTPNLTLQNESLISTTTTGKGRAGNIAISDANSVLVANASVIGSVAFGAGAGGNILVETKDLTVRDRESGISTSSAGPSNAGDLIIRATDSVNVFNEGLISTSTLNTGLGGNILIQTSNLNIRNAGKVFTSSLDSRTYNLSNLDPRFPPETVNLIQNIVNASDQGEFAQGKSGNLTVQATNSINLDNGILSTLADGKAFGGNLVVQTGQLIIQNDGIISSTTFGQGNGGNIQVDANSLRINSTGSISSRGEGQGSAGNIAINLTNDLSINQGQITATSLQTGGGDINIHAEDVFLRNNSLISTSVFDSLGGGGNITLRSNIFLALEDSDILANAEFGPGGDIFINSPVFLADLFGSGRATAVGRNPGRFAQFRGNSQVDISVTANRGSFGQFRSNSRVDISAQSSAGTSGTVTFPNLDLNRGLSQLPEDLIDTDRILASSCIMRRGNGDAVLWVTGNGGLPEQPGSTVPMFPAGEVRGLAADVGTDEMEMKASSSSSAMSPLSGEIMEAHGFYRLPDGQIILSWECGKK